MISVIIPVFNGDHYISDCLSAVFNQQTKESYEVIVVDDGSTDRTAKIVGHFPVRYYYKKNGGPASARNLGLQHARGEIIVFLDADCQPIPTFFEVAIKNLARKDIDALKGFYRTKQTEPIALFAQAEYEYKYRRLLRFPTIDFVDTYAAVYRKEVLINEHGFDELFSMASGEDIELSYRLQSHGYKLKALPDLIVYHSHPDTLLKYFRRKYWVGFWRVWLYSKHPSKMSRDSHTPPGLKYELGALLLSLVALLSGLIIPVSLFGCLGFFLIYCLVSTPFYLHCLRFNPTLRNRVARYILLRDIALLLGYLTGCLRWITQIFQKKARKVH
ncbi:MAG: glycosyltransferase [Patescibacteria group bacterium]|nr:glycosyltransferase [Patescibacteria group bacterium]